MEADGERISRDGGCAADLVLLSYLVLLRGELGSRQTSGSLTHADQASRLSLALARCLNNVWASAQVPAAGPSSHGFSPVSAIGPTCSSYLASHYVLGARKGNSFPRVPLPHSTSYPTTSRVRGSGPNRNPFPGPQWDGHGGHVVAVTLEGPALSLPQRTPWAGQTFPADAPAASLCPPNRH